MSVMKLDVYLKEKRKLVDGHLKKYISSKKKDTDCPRHLSEAMSYALTAGGKRVRPILCIAGYEAVGGTSDTILPVAASLELIHTYSLIHDDLPAMDDDDFRRNHPATHKVYGEATAILAGDALLTDAFYMISQSRAKPKILINIIGELSRASGAEGTQEGGSRRSPRGEPGRVVWRLRGVGRRLRKDGRQPPARVPGQRTTAK